MRRGIRSIVLLQLASWASCAFGAQVPLDMGSVTGANIDESAVGFTLHVDPRSPAADDGNAGDQPGFPKRTLKAALVAAFAHMEAANEGVRIFLREGAYESPALDFRPGSPRSEANLLVIEGEARGKVVVRGSTALNPDAIQSLGNGLYRIDWPEDSGPSTRPWYRSSAEIGSEIAHRREMIYVDGLPLEPVILEPHNVTLITTTSSTEALWTYSGTYYGPSVLTRSGTFGVSEIAENCLYFRPPVGADMHTAEVRIGRPESFLSFRGKSNLVLRNLVFRELGNFHQDPAIRVWGTSGGRIANVLVEDVEIQDVGSGTGLTVSVCDNITIRRLIVRGVGGNGIDGSQNSNYVMEDLDVSANNWRSALGGMRRWSVGGCKLLLTDGLRVSRHVAYANGASGFWMDTEVNNVLIEDMISAGNLVFGLYNEKNSGETLVRDSVFATNGDFGVHSAESWYMTLQDSIVFSNKGAAVGVRAGSRYNSFFRNTCVGTLAGGAALYTYTGDSTRYLDWFVGTFAGNNNRYWVPFVQKAFRASSYYDLDGWRQALPPGQEADSTWEDPGYSETASGICQIYLYENSGSAALGDLAYDDAFNRGKWSQSLDRPVLEIPRNWRKGATVEIHAKILPPESGAYSLALTAGQPAALYAGWDGSLHSVEGLPLLKTDTAAPARAFGVEGGPVAQVQLKRHEPVYLVVRTVIPKDTLDPHLAVAWRIPSATGYTVLAAPFLEDGDEIQPDDTGLGGMSRATNGRRHIDGWGSFDNGNFPWVYSHEHGWTYVIAADPNSFWAFDSFWGWLHIDTSHLPFMLRATDSGWLYYGGRELSGSRWFYDFSTGLWKGC